MTSLPAARLHSLNLTCSLSFNSNSRISNHVSMILHGNLEILEISDRLVKSVVILKFFRWKTAMSLLDFHSKNSKINQKSRLPLKVTRNSIICMNFIQFSLMYSCKSDGRNATKQREKNEKENFLPNANVKWKQSHTMPVLLTFRALSNDASSNSLNLQMTKVNWVHWKKLQVWLY